MLSVWFFQPAAWDFLFLYRIILQVLRIAGLSFIAGRFLLFRAPLLIVWTRILVLRGIKAPYGDLAKVLGPKRDRAGILIHEGGAKGIAEVSTREEMEEFLRVLRMQKTQPRPTAKTIFGGVLRGLFIELGPTFLKLGQIVSMRPEIPPFVREELQLIQDELPPMKFRVVKRVVDREMKELGYRTEDIFEWIEAKPVAAGSLAQVHKAKLRTGEQVALKVQRPRLRATVTIDGSILAPLINSVRRLPRMKNVDVQLFTIAFITSLQNEINFNLEGRTQETFMKRFGSEPAYTNTVKIANVHFDFTTRKLLCMEFVENFHRVDRIGEMQPDKLWDLLSTKVPLWPEDYPAHMVRLPLAMWGDMSLAWGHVHGDPHLGNIYFMEPQDGYGWRIFLCDFGMATEFPPRFREWATDAFRGWMWLGSPYELMRVTMQYTQPREMLASEDMLGEDFTEIIGSHYTPELLRKYRWMTAGAGLDALTPRLYEHIRQVTIPGDKGSLPTMLFKRKGKIAMIPDALELCLTMPKGLVPPGYHLDRFFSPYHWMWFKCMLYIEEMGATLFSGASWNDALSHAFRLTLKEYTMQKLEVKNIVDIRDYVDAMGEEWAIGLSDPTVAESLPQHIFKGAQKRGVRARG